MYNMNIFKVNVKSKVNSFTLITIYIYIHTHTYMQAYIHTRGC